jgi:Glyoxalase-like domain
VLADPEGNEFCAFPGAAPGLVAICTDSPHPAAAAAWWSALVGGKVGPGPDGVPRWIRGAAGLGDVTWKFLPVDDERVVKNRCHWDVLGDPGELVAAGATVLRERDEEIGWTVLADPDGNEFCAFTR